MNVLFLGLAMAALGAPEIESSTLKGEEQAGEIAGLSTSTLTLKKGTGEVEIPLAEVLEIRFPQAAGGPKPAALTPPIATLADGSRFAWTSVTATAREISFETPRLGKLSLPLSAAASLRFAAGDAKIDEAWNELTTRDIKTDLLVIRKDDVLDHLDGTVGVIEKDKIHFVIDGEEVPVKREKVFGIIYAGRAPGEDKPVCELTTSGGDRLRLRTATWKDGKLDGELLAGAPVSISPELLRSVDFSLGKVQFLSQMEPRETKYTPYFDHVWKHYTDRTRDGTPIRLGNKNYARGLWIHSRTQLKYRIGGDYRRFQAMMGIDQAVAPRGDVHVVISGDGKPLLEADVRGADAPQPIDLDVSGVRDLEIFVDFGGDLDIADHLDLADAKVIK